MHYIFYGLHVLFHCLMYVNYVTLIGQKHDILWVTKCKININECFSHITIHYKRLPEKEHVENNLALKTTLC